MSDQVTIQLTEEAKALLQRVQAAPETALKAMATAMDEQNQYTVGHIQSAFLSGPGGKDIATLAVRTGLLRRSLRAVPAKISGSAIVSGIGSNVVYAAAHEFGVDKEVTVRAHNRRNPMGDKFEVAGSTISRITALRAGLLSKKAAGQHAVDSGKHTFVGRGGKSATMVKSGGTVKVRAHSAHMRLAARRFVYRGIADRIGVYGNALSAAVVSTLGGKK